MIQFTSIFHVKEFSCSVPDVEFSITTDYADVLITATSDGSSETVFSERLYPDNTGAISVLEMDRLLEHSAEQWLVFNLSVKVTESDGNTVTIGTQVVSCKAMIRNITAEEFCNTHFLTLLDGKRTTAAGWLEFLTYTGTDEATCTAYYKGGTNKTFQVQRTTFHDEYSMIDVSPDNFQWDGHQAAYYVITAGQRTQEYEVIDCFDIDVAPVLLFFNSFGVQELAYCIGEHQMVSSYDRKQVRIGRKKQSYSIEEKATFKADTGVLTYPMANWWREVLRSKDVQVMQIANGTVDQNSGTPIVINSEKAELSNDADSMPRYTFEYEYADRNHNIMDVRRDGRIFDNTFDYTFN